MWAPSGALVPWIPWDEPDLSDLRDIWRLCDLRVAVILAGFCSEEEFLH